MDSCFIHMHMDVKVISFYHVKVQFKIEKVNKRLILVLVCYIPRVETKERECWKFLDWRLASENDSRLHGQPSIVA